MQPTQEAQSTSGLLSFRQLRTVFDAALDLVFPPRCVHCGRVDVTFCESCVQVLQATPVQQFLSEQPPLEAILSTGLHTGILQSASQALKYYNAHSLAPLLAERLEEALSAQAWRFDIVIPVPLHTRRYRERGYNQANVLSAELAAYVMRPNIPQALSRVQATRSQVGLSRRERQENVANAFRAVPDYVQGRRLLLVDDVRTTGATLAACAEAALNAGAEAVYALTVTAAE